MAARRDCPDCNGLGIVVEGRFPNGKARTCACATGPEILGVPKRFVNCDLTGFKQWWWAKNGLTHEKLLRLFGDALTIVQSQQDLGKASESIVNRLTGFLGDGKPTEERLTVCGLPKGTGKAMRDWVGNLGGENLWIYGPSRAGKTSLAVALMKEHCVRSNCTGAFASVMGIGDALKTFYTRNLGAGTWDEKAYMTKDASEIYGHLMEPECLVLDGIDCIPSDKRIVDNFISVLDRRNNDAKVTIFTALRSAVVLARDGKENLFKAGEPAAVESMLLRLEECYGIEMQPALESALG